MRFYEKAPKESEEDSKKCLNLAKAIIDKFVEQSYSDEMTLNALCYATTLFCRDRLKNTQAEYEILMEDVKKASLPMMAV